MHKDKKDTQIFSVAGPQGSGKSTYLDALFKRLKEDGKVSVTLDDFKVSRTVQARFGWENLDRVYESYESMKRFQQAILRAKTIRDSSKFWLPGTDYVLTERSYMDILSYFELWAKKFLDKGDITEHQFVTDVTAFCEECFAAQKKHGGLIYIPYMEHMKFEYDPQRGFEEDIANFTATLEKWLSLCDNVFVMSAKTVEDRVETSLHLFK